MLIEYTLFVENPNAQRFRVELRLTPEGDGCTQLRFANWTPGSYKIRDYARHVISASAWSNNQEVQICKAGKSTYSVAAAANTPLRIQFEIMATDDSVRGCWLDPWRGHFESSAVFPAVMGHEQARINVDIRPPATYPEWHCATALRPVDPEAIVAGWGHYQSPNWRELIDRPILVGTLKTAEFTVGDCLHRFSIAGAQDIEFDMPRLIHDCQKICDQQIREMSGCPNAVYDFLLRVSPSGPGGLEHQDSTLLACDADALPRADADNNTDYGNLLGLISHEYFHLWNVKRIRPQAVTHSDLDREAPFPDLWAYEGVTAYFDDWFTRRAGTRDSKQYLQVLAEHLTRLECTPGRMRQSLVEASEDAWIRLYQPASHLPNSTVSYYLKGALVAMALDLQMRLWSGGDKSLIGTLAKQFSHWKTDPAPLPPHALEALCRKEFPDQKISEFFERFVYGKDEPDFIRLLDQFGIHATRRRVQGFDDRGGQHSGRAFQSQLGLRLANASALKVAVTEPESCSERAGILPDDVLVAIDGHQITTARQLENVLRERKAGDKARLSWIHEGRLRHSDQHLDSPAENRWTLQLRDTPEMDAETLDRRQAWLCC